MATLDCRTHTLNKKRVTKLGFFRPSLASYMPILYICDLIVSSAANSIRYNIAKIYILSQLRVFRGLTGFEISTDKLCFAVGESRRGKRKRQCCQPWRISPGFVEFWVLLGNSGYRLGNLWPIRLHIHLAIVMDIVIQLYFKHFLAPTSNNIVIININRDFFYDLGNFYPAFWGISVHCTWQHWEEVPSRRKILLPQLSQFTQRYCLSYTYTSKVPSLSKLIFFF